jgi:hypothetical protein
MAFDKNKPLTFNLPDGTCNVITVEWLENFLNENLIPIITQEESKLTTLTQIDNRINEWLNSEGD